MIDVVLFLKSICLSPQAKHRLLLVPTTKMTTVQTKKYHEMLLHFSHGDPVVPFILESEIAKGENIKWDATGKAIIAVLKATGRLKEARSGGLTRYTAVAAQ